MGMLQMFTANSNTAASVEIAPASSSRRYKLVRFDISFDATETGDPAINFGNTGKYTAGPVITAGLSSGFNMSGAVPYDKLPVTDYNESINVEKSTNACTFNVWYEEV